MISWRTWDLNLRVRIFFQKSFGSILILSLYFAGQTTEKSETSDESPCSSKSSCSSAVPQFWTENATKILLAEYKEKNNDIGTGKGSKKKMFQEIAKILNSRGFPFTWEQVQGRIKTLITNFKKTNDYNKKSGNDRKTCGFYEELSELFSGNPTFVGPQTTKETPIFKRKREDADDVESDEDDDENEVVGKEKKKSDADEEGKKAKKTKKVSASSEMLEFLKEYAKGQKEEREHQKEDRKKMHNEKMDLFREMVKTMKK